MGISGDIFVFLKYYEGIHLCVCVYKIYTYVHIHTYMSTHKNTSIQDTQQVLNACLLNMV